MGRADDCLVGCVFDHDEALKFRAEYRKGHVLNCCPLEKKST